MNNLVTAQNAGSILGKGGAKAIFSKGGTSNVQHKGGKEGDYDSKIAQNVVDLTKVSNIEAQKIGEAEVFKADHNITREVANMADMEVVTRNHALSQGKSYS